MKKQDKKKQEEFERGIAEKLFRMMLEEDKKRREEETTKERDFFNTSKLKLNYIG